MTAFQVLKARLAPYLWAFKLAALVLAFTAGWYVQGLRWEASRLADLEAQQMAQAEEQARQDALARQAEEKLATERRKYQTLFEKWSQSRVKNAALDCRLPDDMLGLLKGDPEGNHAR